MEEHLQQAGLLREVSLHRAACPLRAAGLLRELQDLSPALEDRIREPLATILLQLQPREIPDLADRFTVETAIQVSSPALAVVPKAQRAAVPPHLQGVASDLLQQVREM